MFSRPISGMVIFTWNRSRKSRRSCDARAVGKQGERMIMSKRRPLERTRRAKNARQSVLLLLLGVICLLLAWLLHPRAPLGILVFGVGMMIAAVYNPYRLMAAAWITTTIGVPVFLFFGHYIPGNEVFPAYIIALGVGLLGIAMMGRRGYIGRGAVTPGILVLGIGVL